MSKYPEILHRRTVARSRLFRVEAVGLRFSNGAEVEYERLGGTSHGAVLIVAVDGQGRAQLIREYAAGTGRYELGLPKGRVEKDEPLLDAANRELQEEVGVAARRLEWLRSLSLAPGYLAHRTEVILAQDLYPPVCPATNRSLSRWCPGRWTTWRAYWPRRTSAKRAASPPSTWPATTCGPARPGNRPALQTATGALIGGWC